MPYVQRNTNGEVTGLYSNLQAGYAEEALPDDNVEVLAFLNQIPSNSALLAETDKYMNRACEDLIVMLLNKGAISKSDFPQIVWDRINYRRSLRNQAPI